jgi:hypothetical protein
MLYWDALLGGNLRGTCQSRDASGSKKDTAYYRISLPNVQVRDSDNYLSGNLPRQVYAIRERRYLLRIQNGAAGGVQ